MKDEKVIDRGMERTLDEMRLTMVDMSTEELMLWHKHVTNNPYKGGVSERILEMLGVEIVRRGGKVR